MKSRALPVSRDSGVGLKGQPERRRGRYIGVAIMLQDHRQIARKRFDQIMRVPDTLVAITVALLLGVPFFLMLDHLTVGRRIENADIVFVTWLGAAAAILIPTHFLIRLIAAAVIAAITARRAAARQEAQPQSRRLASSVPL